MVSCVAVTKSPNNLLSTELPPRVPPAPFLNSCSVPNNRMAGGTADRVYGDTSKMDAKFDTMIGLLSQANTDRVSGTKKLGGQFEDGMGQR